MQFYTAPRLIRLALFMLAMSMPYSAVHAGLIGTQQILNPQQLGADKLKIQTALGREDVKQILLDHGVSPQQAQLRIEQLTDQEIHQLANRFDKLPAPAGAGVLLLLSGPAMLLLEFMGKTDLTTAF